MTLSMLFKSRLSPHRHKGGKGYEYACPLTLGMESCQLMRPQDNFFYFSNIKQRTDQKIIPLAMIWMRVGRGDM